MGGTVFLLLNFLRPLVVNGISFLVNSSTNCISQSQGTFVQITKPPSPMICIGAFVRMFGNSESEVSINWSEVNWVFFPLPCMNKIPFLSVQLETK